MDELNSFMKEKKVNKAAVVDGMSTEQISDLSLYSGYYLMDKCVQSMKIPKMWRIAHVVAFLKPDTEPNEVKNF